MDILSIYTNLIRLILVVAVIYHIFKKEFKKIIPIALVFILTFLLWFLDAVFGVKVDTFGGIIYMTVIVCTIYLGSPMGFYNKFSWWDRAIHFLSGIMFISFGIALANKVEGLNEFSILFFSLTLAAFLHMLWEVMEYISDILLRKNNQRWQVVNKDITHDIKKGLQPAGLRDTMNDTIFCLAGSAAACVAWWLVWVI